MAEPSFDQLRDVASKLATFMQDSAASLSDPTSVIPHFEEIAQQINFEEIHTKAQGMVTGIQSAPIGDISTSLYKAAAILREANHVSFRKSDYFNSAIAEATEMAGEVSAEAERVINSMKGNSPDMNNSI